MEVRNLKKIVALFSIFVLMFSGTSCIKKNNDTDDEVLNLTDGYRIAIPPQVYDPYIHSGDTQIEVVSYPMFWDGEAHTHSHLAEWSKYDLVEPYVPLGYVVDIELDPNYMPVYATLNSVELEPNENAFMYKEPRVTVEPCLISFEGGRISLVVTESLNVYFDNRPFMFEKGSVRKMYYLTCYWDNEGSNISRHVFVIRTDKGVNDVEEN